MVCYLLYMRGEMRASAYAVRRTAGLPDGRTDSAEECGSAYNDGPCAFYTDVSEKLLCQESTEGLSDFGWHSRGCLVLYQDVEINTYR